MCCSKPKPLIPEHIYICRIKESTDKTRLLIDLVFIKRRMRSITVLCRQLKLNQVRLSQNSSVILIAFSSRSSSTS